jgi:hypothetical protein
VPVNPTVLLRDVHQNLVFAAVRFSVIQGSGSVTHELGVSDGSGNVNVESWILGPGQNVLRAESEGISVLFRATGTE